MVCFMAIFAKFAKIRFFLEEGFITLLSNIRPIRSVFIAISIAISVAIIIAVSITIMTRGLTTFSHIDSMIRGYTPRFVYEARYKSI